MKRAKGWCDICRDEKPDLFCSKRGCRIGFHEDCLRNTGVIDWTVTDLSDFMCQTCRDEEAETECYKCHKVEDGATLLVCDICSRGAHVKCVGLEEEPDGEEWICPVCSRTTQATKTVKSSMGGGTRTKLGNVDICYVCQKGGKLLCCDTCDQSFHPKCIDPEFLESTLREDEEKWGCPICKGQDPLKNMGHKRMTKSERQRRSAEWQRCVKIYGKRCRARRDAFLWECRAALKPFVSPDVLARIKKNALAAKVLEKAEKKKIEFFKASDSKVVQKPPSSIQFKRTSSTSRRVALEASLSKNSESKKFRRLQKRITMNSESPTGTSHDCSEVDDSEVDEDRKEKRIGSTFEGERLKRQKLESRSEKQGRHSRGHGTDESDVVSEDIPRRKFLSSRNDRSGLSEGHISDSDCTMVPIKSFEFKGDDVSDFKHIKSDSPHSVEVKGQNEKLSTGSASVPQSIDSQSSGPIIREKEEVDPSADSGVRYQEDNLLREAEQKANENSIELLRDGVLLKSYQRWGCNWLLDAFENKAGAILADEMGLGKTIQTLTFISALKCRGITGPHLVVVPLSTVGNWAREIRRFTPGLTYTKICGSRQERDHSMSDGVAIDGIYDIFITTYETCVTEEWFFTDGFKWQCVILDEAHRIKNESARIRHSLDRVDCNMRVLLTGTPLQNNVKELFTLLNFLFPDVIRNSSVVEFAFQQSAAKKLQKCSEMDEKIQTDDLLNTSVSIDDSQIEAVTTLLSNLMLRRTKELVVRLPKKIEHEIWLPLSPIASKWYRRLLEVTADVDQSSIRKLLGAVIKMRIACCHPRGLVSRDLQLKNLLDNFQGMAWTQQKYEAVVEEANALKEQDCGWKHIAVSSKLVFLDKLLRHLHQENMSFCPKYKDEYLYARGNQLRKAVNDRKTKLDDLLLSFNPSNTKSKGKVPPPSADISDLDSDLTVKKTVDRLKREIDLLEKDENDGGGLNSLEPDQGIAFSSPSQSNDLFVQHMYPADVKQQENKVASKMDASDNKDEEVEDKSPRPHKVLIFTQFQLVLSELESYCKWRGWSYMRLDGSTNKMIRELDTREFNSLDSNHFVFLISTRAGGLGINLITANHVILFDEDWNPFVDLQAIDRAHRIGQVRNVLVWKLMTEWTVEERMAIRRQQKLKLDKLLIQANVENLSFEDENDLGQSEDKLSTEEVRRLIQYGRTALMEMTFDGIETMNLEVLMNRKRRELKEVEEKNKLTFTGSTEESASSRVDHSSPSISAWESDDTETERTARRRRISIRDAFHENDKKAACLVDLEADEDEDQKPTPPSIEEDDDCTEELIVTPDMSSVETMPSSERQQQQLNNNSQDLHLVEEKFGGRALRPKRDRKKPTLLYNPTSWSERPKLERKLIRERNCFRCGDIGPPVVDNNNTKTTTTTTTSQTTPKKIESTKNNDPLVGCMRCPKVYHMESCLMLDKIPPKSWMCPWHECCVCFRRSGAAGGLLIHCAECPTAFCFDCFPPEYRRYIPPPQYFENLQKRGWPVTPQKLVTFLCSRCKALQEQERRRKLTKQQLEDENKARKSKEQSAKQEARKQQLQSKSERTAAREIKLKETENKKLFLEAKKKIDEVDRQTQEKIRTVIENLYPSRYLEIVAQRRSHYLKQAGAEDKPQSVILDTSPTQNDGKEAQNDNNNNERKEEEEVVAADIDIKGQEPDEKLTDSQEEKNNFDKSKENLIADNKSKTASKKDKIIKKDLQKEKMAAAAAAAGKQRRFILPDRLKRPSETLKLCENCFLPRHEMSQCTFPIEFVKYKPPAETVVLSDDQKKEKSNEEMNTDVKTLTNEVLSKGQTSGEEVTSRIMTTPNIVVELSDTETPLLQLPELQQQQGQQQQQQQIASDYKVIVESEVDQTIDNTTKFDKIDQMGQPLKLKGKPKSRSVCSICKSSSLVHGRRHCSKLNEEDIREYTDRRDKINKFIEILENECLNNTSVCTPARLVDIWDTPKFDPMTLSEKFLDLIRRQIAFSVDRVIERGLREAGLEKCIPVDVTKHVAKAKPAAAAAAKPHVLKEDTQTVSPKKESLITGFFETVGDKTDENKDLKQKIVAASPKSSSIEILPPVIHKADESKKKKRKSPTTDSVPNEKINKEERQIKKSRVSIHREHPTTAAAAADGKIETRVPSVRRGPSAGTVRRHHAPNHQGGYASASRGPTVLQLMNATGQYGMRVPLPSQPALMPNDVMMAAMLLMQANQQHHQQQLSPYAYNLPSSPQASPHHPLNMSTPYQTAPPYAPHSLNQAPLQIPNMMTPQQLPPPPQHVASPNSLRRQNCNGPVLISGSLDNEPRSPSNQKSRRLPDESSLHRDIIGSPAARSRKHT